MLDLLCLRWCEYSADAGSWVAQATWGMAGNQSFVPSCLYLSCCTLALRYGFINQFTSRTNSGYKYYLIDHIVSSKISVHSRLESCALKISETIHFKTNRESSLCYARYWLGHESCNISFLRGYQCANPMEGRMRKPNFFLYADHLSFVNWHMIGMAYYKVQRGDACNRSLRCTSP